MALILMCSLVEIVSISRFNLMQRYVNHENQIIIQMVSALYQNTKIASDGDH